MRKEKVQKTQKTEAEMLEKNKIAAMSLGKVPKWICATMITIIVIQAVVVIAIMTLGMVYGQDVVTALNMTQTFIGENLLSIGIAIVAMAVSVWVGLNIYLSITKEEYETLSEKISKMSENYEEEKKELEKIKQDTKASYLQNQKNIFAWKIDSQRFIYPLSGFLAWMFEQSKDEISAEDYQKLYELEVQYIKTTEYYEQNRWKEAFALAKNLMVKYQPWSRKQDVESVLWYAKIRIADLLFYCFICQKRSNKVPKEITIRQMERTIADYQEFAEKYKNEIANYEMERQTAETEAYIYNTIGYSYDLINQTDSTDENRKKLAVQYMEKAVGCFEDNENKKKARYLRNLGVTYQRQNELAKAKEMYESSLKIDGTDYKTSVNIASIILQQIEKEMKLFRRENVYLDMYRAGFAKHKADLKKAERMCLMAISNSVSFEDSYYKMAQIYIYLSFAEDNEKYLEKAEEKLLQLEMCGKVPTGYLFTKRNWYEAKGDYENALAVSKNLAATATNDVEHMKKLYKDKLDNGSDTE